MNNIDFLSHEQICSICGKPFMTFFETELIIKNRFKLNPYEIKIK